MAYLPIRKFAIQNVLIYLLRLGVASPMILTKRLMQQLPALLMLTALCGVSVAQEVQDDAGQFDRFLMAIADCKSSSTKLSRASCIIEQVFSPAKGCSSHFLTHHFNRQLSIISFGRLMLM